MKLNKILTAAAIAAMFLVQSASAQSVFDTTRTLVLAPPENIVAATLIKTNASIDRGALIGSLTINISSITNTGTSGGALTATIEGASDNTNFTALSNFALITTNTTMSIVNYLQSITNSNPVLLPGLLTTPVAASGGYGANPYLTPLQYTNTGAVTITTSGNYVIAFKNAIDLPRYIHIVFNPAGGTVTNFTVGATLTATPISSTAD